MAQNNIKFFSYTPKQLKPKNLILKGINGNFTEADLLTEITELNLPQVSIQKNIQDHSEQTQPGSIQFRNTSYKRKLHHRAG